MKARKRKLTNPEKVFQLVDRNMAEHMYLDETRKLLKFGVKLYVADREKQIGEKDQRWEEFHELAELVCNYLNIELNSAKELSQGELEIIDHIDDTSPWHYFKFSKHVLKLHKNAKAKKTEEQAKSESSVEDASAHPSSERSAT